MIQTTLAIVVGVVTGVSAIGLGGYKLYRECNNPIQQEIVINNATHTPPSPVIDRVIKDVVKHHLEHVDNDPDTEIDIHINIHSPKERDSNGSKQDN